MPLIHIFCPLRMKSSPSLRARLWSDARSDPAFGSEKFWKRHLLSAEQRLQELLLLRFVRPDQQRRKDQPVGEAADHARAPELLLEDRLVLAGESAAAVLLRIGGIQPALVGEHHVHIPPEVVLVVRQLHPVDGSLHLVRDILLQPRPDFLAKVLLIFSVGIGEIHPILLLLNKRR